MIMQVPRPTDDDKDRFRALVPDDPRVEVKPMFGNLGAFVNGNMFMGLFGSDIGVKVSPTDEERLRAAGGGPFGPAERPMGGYLTLPVAAAAGDAEDWITSALSYVGSLPPKQAKKRSS
jgi:TfoX/Sxy family transcriptional regulator of competence genes